jgi:Pyruvate/2-oxoacid:ferredoxin oxidoreductase delta subunit
MSDDVYHRLARVLDTLPNGFPATESGIEIQLLKKIFRPEDVDLFCDLRLNWETAQQVAERTGRSLESLEDHLTDMQQRGQIFGVDVGGVKIFKMIPWAFGIYEFQLDRMDRELAEICEAYAKVYGDQFFKNQPQLMQVVPVEKEIQATHEALPYEKVSSIIETGKSFHVQDCICKKEQGLLDNPCNRPLEVCLAIAPIEGVFDDHFFICNCCGCCCGVLRSINEWGISNAVNSYYLAEIDPEACAACGTCADERCQVNAIEEGEDAYSVIKEKCIGCGLCVSTCPSEAIQMVRKQPEEIVPPPNDEMDWYEKRGNLRGVDFSKYK